MGQEKYILLRCKRKTGIKMTFWCVCIHLSFLRQYVACVKAGEMYIEAS